MREAAAQRPDKTVAVLLDTKGPEIRTGFFQEKCGGKIHLKAGEPLEITTDYSYKVGEGGSSTARPRLYTAGTQLSSHFDPIPRPALARRSFPAFTSPHALFFCSRRRGPRNTQKGDETKIACTYKKLPQSVTPGTTILIADGSLVLTVTECLAESVKCTVQNDQSIGERKNMNLPNVKVPRGLRLMS